MSTRTSFPVGANVPATEGCGAIDSARAQVRWVCRRKRPGRSRPSEIVSLNPAAADTNRTGFRPEPTRRSGVLTVTAAIAFAYQIEPTGSRPPQCASQGRYEINARTAPRNPGDIQQLVPSLTPPVSDQLLLQRSEENRSRFQLRESEACWRRPAYTAIGRRSRCALTANHSSSRWTSSLSTV